MLVLGVGKSDLSHRLYLVILKRNHQCLYKTMRLHEVILKNKQSAINQSTVQKWISLLWLESQRIQLVEVTNFISRTSADGRLCWEEGRNSLNIYYLQPLWVMIFLYPERRTMKPCIAKKTLEKGVKIAIKMVIIKNRVNLPPQQC